jgi:hypothetical protein
MWQRSHKNSTEEEIKLFENEERKYVELEENDG